ncbi:MAG: M48 family metalloprotease [Deltaproteobacteria bacterium]|nr:M48 family metalloprotease [Deltaproteobacteria bacterium]
MKNMKSSQKVIAIVIIAVIAMVSLVPPVVRSITIKEEEDLSRQMMTAIYKYYDVIDDPVVVDYVNDIGKRILATLPRQPFRYQFHVIKDDVYNAFATPAGHIFVYTGLIDAMEEEEELAGILGHEIAHVYCRHISQQIERQKKMGWASLAGLAAGVLLGVGGAGEAAQAVTMGSQAATQSAALAYSRENEMQADQFGVKFITGAGYSAEGLLKILKKIRSKTWFGSDQIPAYLQTHPAVEDRIAFIGSWIESYNAIAKPIPRVNPDNFNRVHTRVETRYGDEETILSRLEADVARNPGDSLNHYRYGLILARAGKRSEAIKEMRIALTKRAFDPYILKDLGWIYFLDGQFPQAFKTLKSASSMIPKDPECIFYLGRTQMEMGNLPEATDYFQQLTTQYPKFTPAYYYLGQSLGQQDQLGEAHYYLGVYYLRKREYKNALVQLKQALKHNQDADQRKQIEGWLAQLEGPPKKKKK